MVDINKIIKSNNFPNILLLFGEEEFLIEEAVNKLRKALIQDENDKFNFDNFNCDDKEVNASRLTEVCNAFPMMGDRRVVIARNFEAIFPLNKGKKADLERSPFVKYIQNPSKQTILIITANLKSFNGISKDFNRSPDKVKKKIEGAKLPYKIIFSEHSWQEFPKIWENQVTQWISNRFKQYGYNINQDVAILLTTQNDVNIRILAGVVEKIIIYADDKKEITLDMVNYLSGQSRHYNVFELQNAVGFKQLDKALSILNNILKISDDEIAIISVLTRHFSILWKLTEELKRNPSGAAREVGISPFFLNDYKRAVSLYKPTEINNAFLELAKTDLILKSSQADKMYVMQQLIINIID